MAPTPSSGCGLPTQWCVCLPAASQRRNPCSAHTACRHATSCRLDLLVGVRTFPSMSGQCAGRSACTRPLCMHGHEALLCQPQPRLVSIRGPVDRASGASASLHWARTLQATGLLCVPTDRSARAADPVGGSLHLRGAGDGRTVRGSSRDARTPRQGAESVMCTGQRR